MENFNLVKSEILAELNSMDGNLSCCFQRKRSIVSDIVDSNCNKIQQERNSDYLTKTMSNCFKTSTTSHNYIISNSDDQKDNNYCKEKLILSFEDAPKHLQHNPYIRSGYRSFLSTKLCFQSVFWWTNETINIWSHLVGWLLFLGLTFSDISFINSQPSVTDRVIVWLLLVCFQLCMFFSFVYHTFSCRSEKDFDCFLTYDLLGIALSLLAIYMSGIYYAFWCHPQLRYFYSISVAVIFAIAIVIQVPRLNVAPHIKIIVFVSWAAYGILPTTHWTILMGGFHNPIVAFLVSRIIVMYTLSAIAFLFYITKIPERWFTGKLDLVGHSHNWWHLIILCALYYWYNTGIMYLDYRATNGCALS